MKCPLSGRKVLVIGIGGGGDVAAAYCVSKWVESVGGEPILGSVVWERLVRDPVPGPIPLSDLQGAEKVGEHLWVADGDEYAVRGGKVVIPQATELAKATSQKVFLFDLNLGAEGVKRGIEEAIELTGADMLIAVDAGGDVLAKPDDEEVWSPLADAVCLAAVKELSVESWVAIYGPGCDGELPPNKVLERISEVWRRGGNRGGFVVSKEMAEECLRVVERMQTEASKMGLLAALGEYGERRIRRGSRVLFLSPVTATTFFLDSKAVHSELADAVKGTKSLEEANQRLKELRVYTELELERDIVAAGGLEKVSLEEIRKRGRKRLLGEL
ncbi:MAG: DUF1152 domain-containing protein [Crenarchaeota archaeon]|nr:DUF1152 domain-containing protein [Thermoproteota archaeon]